MSPETPKDPSSQEPQQWSKPGPDPERDPAALGEIVLPTVDAIENADPNDPVGEQYTALQALREALGRAEAGNAEPGEVAAARQRWQSAKQKGN